MFHFFKEKIEYKKIRSRVEIYYEEKKILTCGYVCFVSTYEASNVVSFVGKTNKFLFK